MLESANVPPMSFGVLESVLVGTLQSIAVRRGSHPLTRDPQMLMVQEPLLTSTLLLMRDGTLMRRA
jgi:hypothetical protein